MLTALRGMHLPRYHAIFAMLITLLYGCVYRNPIDVDALDLAEGVTVESDVKVHLRDGSIVVYRDGLRIANNQIIGKGTRYGLDLKPAGAVTSLTLDDVLAAETFSGGDPNLPASAVGSIGVGLGLGLGAIALAIALFGSCPTVYALDGGTPVLEAELFSYSIAPLFEQADLDRLGARAVGTVTLEVRNEALETHYIDRVEVISVAHAADEQVYHTHDQQWVTVRQIAAPVSARDRAGNNLLDAIATADGKAWETPAATLRTAIETDTLQDEIELVFAVPPGTREAALLLRQRNSLLNTVLFYETMLKDQGAASLDWLGRDLGNWWKAWRLARGWRETMGMRVAVWRDGRYRPVARIGDEGPIAWSDSAVVLPVDPQSSEIRVRLTAPTDSWRIDQAAVATDVRKTTGTRHPVASATLSHAPDILATSDNRYLTTYPGDAFRLTFDLGESTAERTLFLASEGYYTEWIRREWLQASVGPEFRMNQTGLRRAMDSWSGQRDTMRAQFDASRIPVRAP